MSAALSGDAPTIHTQIDALLDDLLWEARARVDNRFERDAQSDEIARLRAEIHAAVRASMASRKGG